jgi:hypothetical protein
LKIKTSIIGGVCNFKVVVVVKGCCSGYAGEDVCAFGKAMDGLSHLLIQRKTKTSLDVQ